MESPVEWLRGQVRRVEDTTGWRPNVLILSPWVARVAGFLSTAVRVPRERPVRARRWYRRRNKRWLRLVEQVQAAIDEVERECLSH